LSAGQPTVRKWRVSTRLTGWLHLLLTAVALSASMIVNSGVSTAPIPRDNPEALLREATSQLLEVSKAARSYAKDDPERYYAEVERVMLQVLDIDYFARGVMATYASSRLYRSLQTDAERDAFRARIESFVKAIKRVFMVKYADALLTFEGERIDLASVPAAGDAPDHASVQQTIYDVGGETYQVQYSLHRVREGGWMIYNVIVEGVNLGQVYRSQFAEAVEKHQGDVDYVVDHWVDLMIEHDAVEKAVEKSTKSGGGG
jgi:phospholipid transport system substrate-binding protein